MLSSRRQSRHGCVGTTQLWAAAPAFVLLPCGAVTAEGHRRWPGARLAAVTLHVRELRMSFPLAVPWGEMLSPK